MEDTLDVQGENHLTKTEDDLVLNVATDVPEAATAVGSPRPIPKSIYSTVLSAFQVPSIPRPHQVEFGWLS